LGCHLLDGNPYILSLLLMSGVTITLSFVLYIALHCCGIVTFEWTRPKVDILGFQNTTNTAVKRAGVHPQKGIELQINHQPAQSNVVPTGRSRPFNPSLDGKNKPLKPEE